VRRLQVSKDTTLFVPLFYAFNLWADGTDDLPLSVDTELETFGIDTNDLNETTAVSALLETLAIRLMLP
jgi:hypothetical protein